VGGKKILLWFDSPCKVQVCASYFISTSHSSPPPWTFSTPLLSRPPPRKNSLHDTVCFLIFLIRRWLLFEKKPLKSFWELRMTKALAGWLHVKSFTMFSNHRFYSSTQ
jgi:hypothetical protein